MIDLEAIKARHCFKCCECGKYIIIENVDEQTGRKIMFDDGWRFVDSLEMCPDCLYREDEFDIKHTILLTELERVKAEKEAMLSDLRELAECAACVHEGVEVWDEPCRECKHANDNKQEDRFEYRGPQGGV